ncbi:hypothetical protein OG894_42050 (plasmid) [Streptomyces sp. NBC_01724]|uniref:hypothetical protein n=1 Tax=Streptomyces sp. NBC_01724 TaxID=2975922 RepID=UPI002E300D6D|nr:hypothetical protein [Streptomyces sp. NBC_01724]
MSTEETNSLFNDRSVLLREIAKNPAAFANYLADFQRVLLDMQANLEVLQREARVHCRKIRVEGDKWGQARLRSFPVERSLNNVLKDLKGLTSGLEKSAHKRAAHDEKVESVAKQRKERALLKAQGNNPPAIQPTSESKERAGSQNSHYDGPESIHDLSDRRSA